jgi:hypothetical protein
MPQGSPQFTPKQLLDAGRRAEAEGRLDLAHQFYGHLNDHYGHTTEAVEGRHGLARIGSASHYPQVWQMNGGASPAPAANGRLASGRSPRVRYVAPRPEYRVGRALAALLSSIGWLLMVATLAALAAGFAGEFAHIPVPQELKLTYSLLPRAAGALLAGAASLLCGQAARALFDHANAARELVAIERAKAGSVQS